VLPGTANECSACFFCEEKGLVMVAKVIKYLLFKPVGREYKKTSNVVTTQTCQARIAGGESYESQLII